jgi:Fe2+ or Zn2+ uptake regulation protein
LNTERKINWALGQLGRSQVRLTSVREKVLAFLARTSLPATLQNIGASEELAQQFDDATVYRTLVLFVELEIARQVQFQGRQTHFLLNAPGECFSFLVCRCCGTITRIPHGEELRTLESQMSQLYNYSSITHELELFGTCPKCQEHQHSCHKPAKFSPGLRLRGRFRN